MHKPVLRPLPVSRNNSGWRRWIFTTLVLATALVLVPAAFAGHGNPGFESGDLPPWETGEVVDGVGVTGADAFASPYEGSFMAFVGTPAESAEVTQPIGSNELGQYFLVTEGELSFAWHVNTYDYEGYDFFAWYVYVGEELVASEELGAWGEVGDTSYKTTGWMEEAVDLSGFVGEEALLYFDCGGTLDELYAAWCYVDALAAPPGAAIPRHDITVCVTDADLFPALGSTIRLGWRDGEDRWNSLEGEVPLQFAMEELDEEGRVVRACANFALFGAPQPNIQAKVHYSKDGILHEAFSEPVTVKGRVTVSVTLADLHITG